MSNNDLPCNKCKGHHHPACCPLDLGGQKTMSKLDDRARELRSIYYFRQETPMEDETEWTLEPFYKLAHHVEQAILKGKVEEIKHNMTCDSERLNKIRIAELESKIKEKL